MYHSCMKIHIKRWGNSLALRIPNAVAKELNISSDSELDLTVTQGTLVISKPNKYSLTELLKGITPGNIHREIDLGAVVGKEIW